MDNKKIEQLLSVTSTRFGVFHSAEFKWDRIGCESTFNLYVVLGTDTDKSLCHIVFFDVIKLQIKQPVASGLLFDLCIAPDEDHGYFRMKRYFHVYDGEEKWIDFYCTDFEYDCVPAPVPNFGIQQEDSDA